MVQEIRNAAFNTTGSIFPQHGWSTRKVVTAHIVYFAFYSAQAKASEVVPMSSQYMDL
jgi:hypothetical protein